MDCKRIVVIEMNVFAKLYIVDRYLCFGRRTIFMSSKSKTQLKNCRIADWKWLNSRWAGLCYCRHQLSFRKMLAKGMNSCPPTLLIYLPMTANYLYGLSLPFHSFIISQAGTLFLHVVLNEYSLGILHYWGHSLTYRFNQCVIFITE